MKTVNLCCCFSFHFELGRKRSSHINQNKTKLIHNEGESTITNAIIVFRSKSSFLVLSVYPGVSNVHNFLARTTTKRFAARGMNSELLRLHRACRSIARLLERERKSECAEGYTDTPWENSLLAEDSS